MGKGKNSSLSNALPQKTYKERVAPTWRKSTVMERHKDYQIRSRKQHQVEEKRKYYQMLIASKNVNEYNMDMANGKKNQATGKAVIYKLPQVQLLPHEEQFDAKVNTKLRQPGYHIDMNKNKKTSSAQAHAVKQNTDLNLNILRSKLTQVQNKIENLRKEHQFLGLLHYKQSNSSPQHQEEDFDAEEPDADFDDDGKEDFDEESEPSVRQKKSAQIKAPERKHVVFVDSTEQVEAFNPQEFFDTAPELAGRVYNRPKQSQLINYQVDPNKAQQVNEQIRKNQWSVVHTLNTLIERSNKLKQAIKEMETARTLLLEKDNIENIEKDEDSEQPTYMSEQYKHIKAIKMKQERKK